MNKIIIAGSRDIDDAGLLFQKLGELLRRVTDIEVVSGGARGPDKIGELWAQSRPTPLPVKQFIPDWEGLGKSAGYVRNMDMADYADRAIIFWDGESKGTKHMIDIATEKGLKVEVINCRKEWVIV